MRRIGLTCFIVSVLVGLGSTIVAADKTQKKRIAVGDFKTDGTQGRACQGHPSNYGDALAANLRTRLVETKAFSVLSREQINKVMREHDMVMGGLADAKKGKIGKSAGVTEDLMLIDSKVLHAATQMVIADISRSLPTASAQIEEVNAYGDTIKVKISGAVKKASPGLSRG